MEYAASIEALAEQVGAKVVQDVNQENDTSFANIDNELHVPKITDEITYWTALHELGHIARQDPAAKRNYFNEHPPDPFVSIFGRDPYPADKLLSMEAGAWKWALTVGGTPTPKAAARAAWALGTYQNQLGYGEIPPRDYIETLNTLTMLARGEVYRPPNPERYM